MAKRFDQRLVGNGQFATSAEAHQLFAGSCFSSALARGTLCRWLLMAAVAPPYLTSYPQASHYAITMSALPPKADMCSALAHVGFGPIADSCSAANSIAIRSPRWRGAAILARCSILLRWRP